jgi:hypothetical protein
MSDTLLNYLTDFSYSGRKFPVKVESHKSLNSSKGVARDPEFKLFTEDEIVSVLSEQGVTHARRIEVTRGEVKVPTGTVILTFDRPQIPNKIKLGFRVIEVDAFIPNPMRCFRCQKFGHTADRCKRNITCSVCAEEGHDDRGCTKTPKCVNCEGVHASNSKSCPVWQQERRVQEVRVQNKIPYFEAKKQVLGTTPSLFYSSIVKSKVATLTVSTQTEEITILCPHCSSQFKMTPDVILDRNSQSSQTTFEAALPTLQSSIDSPSCTAQTPVETCTYRPFNQTPVISPSAISGSAGSGHGTTVGKVDDVPPAPQEFIADDGTVVKSEKARQIWNKALNGWKEEDTDEDCDEILEHVSPAPPAMEVAPPVPRTFITDDGQVFPTEELMLKRNKEIVGCKLLPMRSRSINQPSHVSGSSRKCESWSPVRPPR